jgi:putative heme-binding domain-containing protein
LKTSKVRQHRKKYKVARILKGCIHHSLAIAFLIISGCDTKTPERNIRRIDPAEAAASAKAIESAVTPQLEDKLTLRLWAIDSLVADPVSLHVDNLGRLYYTRTNRQKNSELEIRAHRDWEIESMKLKTVEDRSNFLKRALSTENSDKNSWLADLNRDGSRDWKDLTVEKEEVYRLEDESGDGVADFSQMIVNDFNTEVTDVAGAILTEGKDLFIGVSPDMWRMKDKDGDGVYEEKTSISNGYGVHVGFGGHGMSGLEIGPEGKLYWQIGDLGFSGKGPDGKVWEYPNTGVIVRANPDGSDFEVFAYGNRNTHEFVFDDYGNLITEDNDGDHHGEKERLVYVVNGADIGWRINWQFGKYRDPDNNRYKVWMDEKMYLPRFEGQAAYFIPPIANYVSGPTGMLYNPGTALSPEWKNTFFVGEFVGNPTQSGIHAFKLKPNGASFELAEYRNILTGVLATGIDFGPDGAIYLADWIQGWNTKNFGRVWKLDVENGESEIRKQTQKLLSDNFDEFDEARLSELLKHEDKRVRQKSQFELVKRNEDGLKIFENNLQQKEHQLARIHAIWGISQFARVNSKHAALLVPLLTDQDPEIRAQAAKWLGDVKYAEAGSKLIPLLKDTNSRVSFFAAEALGRIAYAPATAAIIDMLRDNNDKDVYLRHAGTLALARIGKSQPVIELHKDLSRAVRIAAVVTLRRMSDPGIVNFLQDKDEFIVTETARAINDDLNIPGAIPALGDLLLSTPFSNEALIRRAINANLEAGTDKALQNLIAYARRESAPQAMRSEAIEALSTWSRPSVLDRVDGRYRGEIVRDPEQAKTHASDALIMLTSHPLNSLRIQSIKAISKLKIEGASAVLLAKLKNDKDPMVRVEVLKAFEKLNDPMLNQGVKAGLADTDRSVRVIALDLLGKVAIPDAEKVSMLSDVINKRTTEERQAALTTLANLPSEKTIPVLEQLMTKAEAGKLPDEINIEFVDAIEQSKSAELLNRYKNLTRRSGPDSLFNQYKGTLLGGSDDRGRSIFFSHQTAQCLRCHSFDDLGGNAGPRLNGIASRLNRKQILESLIEPSSRIAPGYGVVTVELKNGTKISGIRQEETPTGVVIKSGQKPDTLISKSDILKSTQPASSMPPMHLLLTKKEIRDLVSFLASLK